jgi:hypothetical protein
MRSWHVAAASLVWSAGRTVIWMLRPLIETLKNDGCPLGFSVSSEPRKWQAVLDDIYALNRDSHGSDVSKYQAR